MRHAFLVYLVTAAAASALACTAILGDFTTSGGPGSDGGLGDGATGDGAVGDGGTGDGGGDTGADAPPPLRPLSCPLTSPKVTFSYSGLDGGIAILSDSPRLFVYPLLANGQFRLVVVNGSVLYYADFHENDSQPVPLQAFALPNGFVITALRYPAGAGFTSGTAFMTLASDPSSSTVGVFLFSDDAAAPTAGTTVADSSSGVLPPNLGGNSGRGTFEVVDPTNKEYLVAFQFSGADPTKVTLVGTHVRGGATGALKTIDTNLPATEALAYSIVHDATLAYVLVSPPSQNGPPTGPMPLYKLNVADMSRVATRQLAPDSGFYAPFAFQTNKAPETVDLAFVEADLNDPNGVPKLHATQLKISDLDTFNPGATSATSLTLAQLPFNKGVSAWSFFPSPAGDQWVAISRPLQDGTPGLTFLWVDSMGRLRAAVAETDGGAGWPGTLVGSAAATLVGAPSLGFATVRIAWVEGQAGNARNPPLYSMGGNCLP